VSELFIERTRTALGELMGRRLDGLAVMMLGALEIADRTHVVALGISTEGVKIPLGLWEGSTENATLVSMLLADLVDRGVDPEQAILFVIDGGKALRKAIKDVFGEHALVHRDNRHKERNVRYTQRDVKRWRDGDMRKRWTAAGMLVAEQQFRRIIGYRDLAKLVIAIERHTHLVAENNHDRQKTRQTVTV
jgi:transposase-like protein